MSDKMKEYIEREAALKWQVPHYSANGVEIIEGKAIPVEYIENLPAADVVEVKHGWWIIDKETGDCYCSVCNQGAGCTWYNYCYDCGAKMDDKYIEEEN